MNFLDRMIFGNSIQAWLIAVLITLLLTMIAWLVKQVFIARLIHITDKTKTRLDNVVVRVLSQTKLYLMVILAFYFGSMTLTLPERTGYWLGRVAFFTALIQIAVWGNELITSLIQRYQEENLEDKAGNVTTMRAASFLVKLALFSIILLLALDNAGVKIDTLIASLGIGSIAVALAVQNILADLFASLSIAYDQPFVIGDFIIVDDYLGTVENIGLKTTRVRSLSGEQLIFANNDLLNSRIRNYKRMEERRIVFSFGVTYQTPHALLEKIPGMVREIVESQEHTRFDRAHFKTFGDSSLVFEVVYYVLTPEYNLYMNIQQNINLALVKRFEADKIEFAYPTQTLYLKKESVMN